MRIISLGLALALASSAALAADIGPLSAGKPAGVKKAQVSHETAVWVVLGAGAVAGIAVAASGGGGGGPAAVTPPVSSTSTTG